MKIVFLGTSEFSVFSLQALSGAGFTPIAIITAPDKPAGRGKKVKVSAVKEFSRKFKEIKLFQPEKITPEFVETIKNLHPDVGVVASYGKILPKAFLEIFPKGLLNVHPSLLPKYRGPSPIQAPILNGDERTGVTVILVDEKMDHGPVLSKSETRILKSETYIKLHDKLAKLGAELLVETLTKWTKEEIVPQEQNHEEATFTKMIKKDDGLLDFSAFPEKIDRMVRAYNPWPGTFTKIENGKILKIKKVEIKDGKLKILTVQPEGKKEMPYEAFLRGHRNFVLGD